jgi:hypothetical protein
VRLRWDGREVRDVALHSTRALATPRVLAGRRTDEAAAMVPLLYSVCAFAQGSASVTALDAARGHESSPAAAARGLGVALEAVQEDLRRLLIDLPVAAGGTARVEPVARARKAIAPLLASLRPALALDAPVPAVASPDVLQRFLALVADDVLGMPVDRFVAFDHAEHFTAWAAQRATPPAALVHDALAVPGLGASDVALMPRTFATMAEAVLDALDADPGFARTPHWQGRPLETGALAHCTWHPGVAAFAERHGHGVAARIVARVVDLATTVATLAKGLVRERVAGRVLGPGEGAATVQTARGLLLHRARVADERIADYAIVAPTEWNFHPYGPLVRALDGLVADDERALVRQATLVVQSLDPCVACSVEIEHA